MTNGGPRQTKRRTAALNSRATALGWVRERPSNLDAFRAGNFSFLRPSNSKRYLEMNNAYNTSGLSKLKIAEDVQVLSEAEAAPWRRALAAVRKHLRPSPDFIFYIQAQLCEDFAREGDLEASLFFTKSLTNPNSSPKMM